MLIQSNKRLKEYEQLRAKPQWVAATVVTVTPAGQAGISGGENGRLREPGSWELLR